METCRFVNIRTSQRCTNPCEDFCDSHANTLQARRMQAQIHTDDGVDYLVKEGSVYAYVDAIRNRPLTKMQMISLKKKNVPIHPYVEERLNTRI